MTFRIVAFALLLALVGGLATSSADATPVYAADVDDPAAELGVPPEPVVFMTPVRTLIAPSPPPLAQLHPRLHVDDLLRPPRG